jgi:hypothetical protein
VTAHEKAFDEGEYRRTIKEYNQLQEGWDFAAQSVNLKMQAFFSSPGIRQKWRAILDELGTLDDEISDLEDFQVTDEPSVSQKQQITKCRNRIEHVEGAVGEMTRMMNDYTEARIRRQ